MRVFHRTVPFIFLISLFMLASASIAQERSRIGDGRLYYCMGTEGNAGAIYRVKGGKKVSLKSALSNVSAKISKVRSDIKKAKRKKKDTSKLTALLRKLLTTLADIKKCYSDGSTGKSDDSGSPDVCAVVSGSQSVNATIVNGKECSIGESPVVYVALAGEEEGDEWECTGTVVAVPGENSSRAVITAAHCVDGAVSAAINVPDGVMEASEMYMYPDWYGDQEDAEKGDVAVLLFEDDISTKAVHVAASDFASAGMTGVIAGYGVDENDEGSEDLLRAGKVTLANVDSVRVQVEYDGTDSNTCSGDSGGPLFLKSGSEWVLAAVTSNGTEEDCGPGDLAGFVNLRDPDVIAFINETVPGLIPEE